MSEISVLVSGNVAPKVKDGGISTDGNSVTDNSAAMEFAAIFGGWMAQAIGQGQDSGNQSNDPAGKEANSGQKGNQGLEGVLGSLRTIAGLNLGFISSQDQKANETIKEMPSQEIKTLFSKDNLQGDAADSGIELGQLQGENSPLTELDQYRVLIEHLLQDMSGKIDKVSLKPVEIQALLSQLGKEMFNPSGEITGVQTALGQFIDHLLNQNAASSQDQRGQGDLIQTQTDQPLDSFYPQNQSGINQSELNALVERLKQELHVTKNNTSNNFQNELQNKSFDQEINNAQPLNSSSLWIGQQSQPNDQITESGQRLKLMAIQNTGKEADSNLDNVNNIQQTLSLSRNLKQDHTILSENKNTTLPDELPTENHLFQMKLKTEIGQSGSGNTKNELLGSEKIASNEKSTTVDSDNSGLGNLTIGRVNLDSTPDVKNRIEASSKLPIWNQVAQQLQAKILHQPPSVREINIQLHPAELGQINITLAWDNGHINLHMLASEASTGQILQSNFPELRESLSQSGIQCGMMQMGFADSNPNFDQRRNQTFSSAQNHEDKQSEGLREIDDIINVKHEINDSDVGARRNRINVTA